LQLDGTVPLLLHQLMLIHRLTHAGLARLLLVAHHHALLIHDA
jgi:hypothetical protein